MSLSLAAMMIIKAGFNGHYFGIKVASMLNAGRLRLGPFILLTMVKSENGSLWSIITTKQASKNSKKLKVLTTFYAHQLTDNIFFKVRLLFIKF